MKMALGMEIVYKQPKHINKTRKMMMSAPGALIKHLK
jgi:hypothetical protein